MVQQMKEIGVDEVACLIDFGVDEDSVLASLYELDRLRQYSSKKKIVETFVLQVLRICNAHSQASMFVLEPETLNALSSLQKLLLGVKGLPVSLAYRLDEVMEGTIYNMYGPTETTIWSTTHPVEKQATAITIGRPIANTQIYILDRRARWYLEVFLSETVLLVAKESSVVLEPSRCDSGKVSS